MSKRRRDNPRCFVGAAKGPRGPQGCPTGPRGQPGPAGWHYETCTECGFPIWQAPPNGTRHPNPLTCVGNLQLEIGRYRDDHRAAMAAWDVAEAMYDIPETIKILSTMVGESEGLKRFMDRLQDMTAALDEIERQREDDDHADQLIGWTGPHAGFLDREEVRQKINEAIERLKTVNFEASADADPKNPKE